MALTDESHFLNRHGELILAILLGVTAFIGAGAAFRGGLAGAESNSALNEAGQLRTAATAHLAEANQNVSDDQAVWLQYEQAKSTGQTAYATLVQSRMMSDNLRTAVTWWEAHPEAVSPFVEGSPYSDPEFEQAKESNAKADERMADFEAADARSTVYGQVVTLLAVSLFMFGVAAVLKEPRVRVTAAAVGIAVIVLAIALVVLRHAL